MSKNLLIIYGHPVRDTFSEDLLLQYRLGAESTGASIRQLNLRELDFELNLRDGYRQDQELEPDLLRAREDISWAEHIVFIFPNWWATFPALLKGFIDRTFLPGFAFKYVNGRKKWIRLLNGKTARIIITMDDPVCRYRFRYGSPGLNALKKGVLHYCGIKPVRHTLVGPVKHASEKRRQAWGKMVRKLGENLK
jgi:putative NADPH-quinone reductase